MNNKFAYYYQLSKKDQMIYDRSDEITKVNLKGKEFFKSLLMALEEALHRQEKEKVQKVSQEIVNRVCHAFRSKSARVKVLAVRPSNQAGELHGLYERYEERAEIKVWMRTVQKKQVVQLKTFLRTLLHEVLHHLDYEVLQLADSFHTKGFYRRESSLFKQVMDSFA